MSHFWYGLINKGTFSESFLVMLHVDLRCTSLKCLARIANKYTLIVSTTPSCSMQYHRFVCLLGVVLALCVGALGSWRSSFQELDRRRALPAPLDPFYKPPSGWHEKAPGAILRTRKIDVAQFGVWKLGVNGYQLLYRTNGIHEHDPSYSVTTVLVPDNYDKDKLVSANVYEDSYSSQCAPSYSLRAGSRVFKNYAIHYQLLFFTTLLSHGWVVTVPDHEGPKNAFTSGFLEGHAVLDAIRATMNFDQLSLSKDAKVVGYGYSGGALATGWAASLHKKYASELPVVGWSLGGTIANLKKWLQYVDGSIGSGFALASLAGLTASYPELSWVQDSLTSKGKAYFEAAKRNCMYENLTPLTWREFFSDDIFHGGSRFFQNDQARNIFHKLVLGGDSNLVPKAPVFMFHAKHDETVPYDQAHHAASQWCNQGAQIRFLTIASDSMRHSSTELADLAHVLWFIQGRFKGEDWGERCQWPSVGIPYLEPDVLGQTYVDIVKQVIDLWFSEIGHAAHILYKKVTRT